MTIRFLAVLGRGQVDPADPVVRADDPGLIRGDGCFEGCRVVGIDGPASVDKLDAHLDRMARSAGTLGIPFDVAAWRGFVADALPHAPAGAESALKLVLTRGTDAPVGMLIISDLPAHYPRQRRDGLRVITLDRGMAHDAFTGAPWLLGGVKTLSYAVNMAAQREAERRGCDDVILVSSDGVVLEAPTSSVVWARGRTLATTPPGASGILGGTTQERLFARASAAGWGCGYAEVTVPELGEADVVWLIGSVRGPVDVVELDGRARARWPEIDDEIRRLAGFGPATG